MKELTSKEKDRLKEVFRIFYEKRDPLDKLIGSYRETVIMKQEEISRLEKEIDGLRPVVKGAQEYCHECDAYSSFKENAGYTCIVCGKWQPLLPDL